MRSSVYGTGGSDQPAVGEAGAAAAQGQQAGAPAEVDEEQLRELHMKWDIKKPEPKKA